MSSIQEFLLARLQDDDSDAVRAEVERHRDRTMTVVFRDRVETITRCGTCPKEPERPCTAMRELALPFADHPQFRPEWRVPTLEVAEAPAVADGQLLTLPLQRTSDLPPPGNARRRILREFGIGFGPSDFTDEELARRGVRTGPRTAVPLD
jgi:hypothetical protein